MVGSHGRLVIRTVCKAHRAGDVLHIPAELDASIACDMSTAEDTAEERLADYQRQFGRALLRRERREDSVVFAFRADGGTREALHDLARREAACCPFLDYRVETTGDGVTFAITNPVTGSRRAEADATLDAFYALPDDTGSDVAGLMSRLAERGVDVVGADAGRQEVRESASG